MEGFEQFDDDAAQPFSFGPPADRTWRHPSELSRGPIAAEPVPSGGFPFRILTTACVVALAASLMTVAMATLIVSTRSSPIEDAVSASATTVDSRIERLLTLVIEDATGRRSIPGIVLDKVGTIVAAWTGFDQAKSVTVASDTGGQAVARVERAGLSPLALVTSASASASAASPIGSCDNLTVGSVVQVMTAAGSVSGAITALTKGSGSQALPVLVVRTTGGDEVGRSIIWHDGKIIALSVDRQADGQLVAIPSDVALGLARSAAAGSTGVPWLGVMGTNSDGNGGVLITSISPSAPADGVIYRDDTIVSVDDQPVRTMWALSVVLRRYVVGETVNVRVVSHGETRNLHIKLSQRPTDEIPAEAPTSSIP